MFDVRRKQPVHPPIIINNEPVDQVDSFKYLGVVFRNDLTWSDHVAVTYAKAYRRIFFLKKLKQAGVSPTIMCMFYNSVVLSVLSYCVSLFMAALNAQERSKLEKVDKSGKRIIGPTATVDSLASRYGNRVKKMGKAIMNDHSHPLHHRFELLPSGRRLRSAALKNSTYNRTFVPSAITLLNSSGHINIRH